MSLPRGSLNIQDTRSHLSVPLSTFYASPHPYYLFIRTVPSVCTATSGRRRQPQFQAAYSPGKQQSAEKERERRQSSLDPFSWVAWLFRTSVPLRVQPSQSFSGFIFVLNSFKIVCCVSPEHGDGMPVWSFKHRIVSPTPVRVSFSQHQAHPAPHL